MLSSFLFPSEFIFFAIIVLLSCVIFVGCFVWFFVFETAQKDGYRGFACSIIAVHSNIPLVPQDSKHFS